MGTHPGRILPLDFHRCPSRLKFLGPCAPRHRRPLVLVGGKDGPIISGGHTEALELQLGGHRRPSRGWSPKSRNALAGVLGPLDRLGVGTRVRKDGPAQRSLSPVPQERLRSWTSSRQTVPASKARCSKKGARHRGEACEYPQASCQSGPGSWDLSTTSLWGSVARHLHSLIGPG